jgi:RHS repeat-associated protein
MPDRRGRPAAPGLVPRCYPPRRPREEPFHRYNCGMNVAADLCLEASLDAMCAALCAANPRVKNESEIGGVGNMAQWLDYAPYGSVVASENTGTTTAARQYIGQFSDASGLSYLNARYYNGTQGQFTSEDPVFLGNPSQLNLQDPQSLNAYSYSEDNTIVKDDPLGKYFQVSVSGTAEGLSGSAGVQFTMFPPAANVVAAGGFGAGLEGSPFSFAYTSDAAPQDTGPTVSVGGDAVYGAGFGADTSGTYVPSTYSLENQSTSYSFVVGGGADIYLRKQYSISMLGGPTPQGLTLSNTSNFSTPNYVATSPQIYYSGGSTYLSAPLHAIVPQAPTVGVSSGGGGSLPSTVSQGGITYYRNSSGLLSTTPGH